MPPPKALWGPEPRRAVNKPASLYHTGHQRHARAPLALQQTQFPPVSPQIGGGQGEGRGRGKGGFQGSGAAG